MTTILQMNASVLRDTAQLVPVSDISSLKIKKVIQNMKTALAREEDGVAIAAPQIGEALRIFVVSKKVSDIIRKEKHGEAVEQSAAEMDDTVHINPTIIKLSRDKKELEEGCLSVRYLYGKVKRSTKAIIESYNERGEKVRYGASGLLAQIFQHEIDHLDGVLFIDKAKDIQDLPPPKAKKK